MKYIGFLLITTLCFLDIAPFFSALPSQAILAPRIGRASKAKLALRMVEPSKQTFKLSGPKWFKKVFKSPRKPRLLSEIKAETGFPCIIDSPLDKMSNPYLGNNLYESVLVIKKILKTKPNPRDKPVAYTVKGVGGGKTRLFEGMRREINKESRNNVVIAVTFNNFSLYSAENEKFVSDAKYAPLNIILSIICRIAVIVYGNDFATVSGVVTKHIDSLNCDSENLYSSVGLALFIRSFIDHIMYDLDKSVKAAAIHDDDRNDYIENFLLLVDEIMRVKTNYNDDGFQIALSALNQGLLNDKFAVGNNNIQQVNTGLAISSLDIAATNVTLSGRAVVVLLCPDRFNRTDIVQHWWFEGSNITLSDHDSVMLGFIASSVNTLPRVVEIVNDYIQGNMANFLEKYRNGKDFVDDEFIRELKEFIFYSLGGRYTLTRKGNIDYLKLVSLLLQEPIKLDDNAMTMISSSIITNSLKSLIKDDIFIPHGSILMLAFIFKDPSDPMYIFYELLQSLVDCTISKNTSGSMLEVVFDRWFRCLVLAAGCGARIESMSYTRLFSLDEDTVIETRKNIPRNISLMLPLKHPKGFYVKNTTDKNMPSIVNREGKEDFVGYIKAFNKHTERISENEPFLMYESVTGQSYDQLIVARIAGTVDDVFVTFVDEKSSDIVPISMTDTQPKKKHFGVKETSQYQRILKVVETLKVMVENNSIGSLSSAGKALLNGNFRFIYFTTADTVTVSDELQNDKHLIFVDKRGAERFLGIIFDTYQAARMTSLSYTKK